MSTTYQATLNWMFAQLPMYQRQGKTAFKKDLTNILAFSEELQHPHQNFKSIHVGGTNGKGSVSHMLASVLQESGYKVGLYTSPHLKDFRERIKIDGVEVSEEFVIEFIQEHQSFLEKQKLSFFEMTVAMAFQYFSEEKVDIAIIEVGLGGRLDSTNIIIPELSVITNIGLDHTQFLGDTHQKIAVEKAGIIKPEIPVVIGETLPETKKVFLETAKKNNAEIYFTEDEETEIFESDLKGSYQTKNIKTVCKSVEVLSENGFNLTKSSLVQGLRNIVINTGLRGRWDCLQSNPKVICDTAHNKEGLTYVLQQLKAEKYNQLHIVLGVVNDKDLASILPLFPKEAMYYFSKPNVPRGLDAEILKGEAEKYDLKGNSYANVETALQMAKNEADKKDLIFIGGSTFTAAEII